MTSFDKKPVKKVVAVTAIHGKKMETKRQKADQNNRKYTIFNMCLTVKDA